MTAQFESLRNQMVEAQIIRRGITDPEVIRAMRQVPRHEFVLEADQHLAYEDKPISIGEGQTISQPYMVALMTQNLQLNKRKTVLEIGTGSGYQTAILATLSQQVYSFERIAPLAERAQEILERLQYTNVHVFVGDGSVGVTDASLKFDGIMITAASPDIPKQLFDQLKPHGRLVVPIGNREAQILTLFTKTQDGIKEAKLCSCIFVPLLGKYGWTPY